MRKKLPTLRLLCLSGLFLIASAFGSTEADKWLFQLQGDSHRQLFFLNHPQADLSLCGLVPGQEYTLWVNPASDEPGFSLQVFGDGVKAYPVVFQAQAVCQAFIVQASGAKQLNNEPVVVTLSRKSPAPAPGVSSSPELAPITTNSGPSVNFLIQDVFIAGDCFDVTNITSSGNAASRGTFANGNTSINIADGVIISTGNIANATGPNNATGAGTDFGGFTNDPDLSQIAGNSIEDVSRIEFDFTPSTSTVSFEYVFASEEYCDYTLSNFNDVFGFFISGPGISGPFTGGAANIAVIPSTTTPVTINNVNHIVNTAYYVGNIPNSSGQLNDPDCAGHPIASGPPVNDCQFDGFTVVLTATAAVIPCSTYHIKLAIADVGDGIFDSAVFLKANSFDSGGTAEVTSTGSVTGTNIIYEGCTNGFYTFVRDGADNSQPLTINFTILPSSTATPGVDYTTLPTSVTIPAGQNSITLPVNVIADLIAEGQESILLELDIPCQCSDPIIEIFIQDPPPINVNATDVEFCGNGASVTLNANASGGAPLPGGLTYSWSNGSTGSSITVNPSGTTEYIVTVTDPCGNTATDTSTVTITQPPTATLSGSGVLCANGGAGQVTLTVNFTGSAPWTFVYTDNGVQQPPITTSSNPYTFTVTTAGTYSLSSVANLGGDCPGTVSGSANITETNINLQTTPTNVACNGAANGVINLTVSGGTPAYTYNWSNGASSEDPGNLPPGSYSVTVTDANGCTQNTTADISEPPALNANITGQTNVDCDTPTGNISLSVNGGTPGYTFNWSNGATSQNPSNLPPGSYTVTITDANGCQTNASATITQDITPPVAAASTPGVLTCSEPQLVISGAGSSSGPNIVYNWSTQGGNIVSGGNTLSPTIDAPGTYTITVTNTTNGCTATANVTVTENVAPPVATATAPTLTCAVTQVTINGAGSSAGPDFTYNWSPGGNIISGQGTLTPVVGTPGSYTLTVTNTVNGCTTNFTVNVPSNTTPPIATATAGNITCTQLAVVINGSGSSAGPNFTYNWTTPDGNIVAGSNSPNPTVNQPGTYNLVVTNTTNGCTANATVNVGLDQTPPTLNIQPPSQLNCTNTSITLNTAGSTTGPNITYQWSTPNGNIISGPNTPGPIVNQPGAYNVLVTNTTNGCTTTGSVTVTQDIAPPTAVVAPAGVITCFVPQITLNGAGSSSGSNFSYNWSTNNGNIVSGQTTLNPVVGGPGTYTLTVTNTANGCTTSTFVIVTANNTPPVANAGPPQVLTCTITQVQLNGANSSAGPNFTYQWATASGNIVAGANSPVALVNAPGIYTLTVTNNQNGCISSSNVSVTVDENVPIAVTSPGPAITCNNPIVTISGAGSSVGPNFSYLWTTSNGNIINGVTTLNPAVNQPGVYQLTVSNSVNGCTSSSFVTVADNTAPPVIGIAQPGEVNCFTPLVTIDATASVNQGSFSYLWSSPTGNIVSGQGTTMPVVDEGGVYTLTIFNNTTGCTSSASVVVPENINPPNILIQPAQTITCTLPQISLNANGSSTGPQFQYTWTTANGNIVFGSNTLTPVVSGGGTYTLTIFNSSNNCSSTSNITVAANNSDPTVALASDGILNCTNPDVQLSGTIGGGSNLQFVWSTPDGNIVAGSGSLQPTVNEPGSYILNVVNATNGCTNADTIAVAQDIALPVADVGPAFTLTCYDPVFTIQGQGSSQGAPFQYQWSTPDGNILNGQTTLNPEVDASGTYFLTVINQDNTCQSADTLVIAVDQEYPPALAGADQLLGCWSPTLTLDGSGSAAGADIVYQWTTPDGNILSGDQTLNPVVDGPGLYTLTVMDTINGCQVQDGASVVLNQDYPQVDAGPGGELTCSVVTITLQGTAAGNVPDFDYLWTTPDGNIISGNTTLNPVVDAPGIYTLTVQDMLNGCVSTAEVEITKDANVPVAVVDPLETFNCVNFDVVLDGTGSTQNPNISFEWTTTDGMFLDGANTLTPTIGMPGTYTLILTDSSNNCVTSNTLLVAPDTVAPVFSIAPPAVLTCFAPEISLQAAISGNPAIFDILWTTADGNITGGAASLSPEVDAPGVYQASVVNTINGCETELTVDVAIDQVYPLVDAGPTGIITCAVTTLTLQGTANTGSAPFEVLWTTSDGNILSGDSSLSPLINQDGLYEMTVQNTQNGCVSNTSVQITDDLIYPLALAGPSQTITCSFPTLILDGAGSSEGSAFVYSWTTPDGNILSGANTLFPEIDEPGTYELEILNTVNGCLSEDQVQILENTVIPTAAVAQPGLLTCSAQQIQIDASASSQGPGMVYTWTTPDGFIVSGGNTPLPTVNEPGLYQLEVLNTVNGCLSNTAVQVDQDADIPLADAGSSGPITCAATSIQLDATNSQAGPNFAYAWTTANGNIVSGGNTLTPVIDAPGLYSLSVTNTDNDCVAFASVQVPVDSIFPLAEAGPVNTLTCAVTTLSLIGASSSVGSPFSYQWSTPDGNILSGANGLTPLIDQPGDYTLTVQNTANGCVTTDQTTVLIDVVPPLASAVTPGILTCAIPQLNLSGTGSSSGSLFTYQWTTTNGNIVSGGAGLSPVIDEPGLYQIEVLNNQNGCSTTASVQVAQDVQLPAVDAGQSALLTCAVTNLSLTGTASANSPDLGYLWTTGDGNILSGSTTLSPNIDEPGTYTLTVTNNTNGCVASDQVFIPQDVVEPVIALAPPGLLTCAVTEWQLNATGSDNGAGYNLLWTTTNGNILSGNNTLTPVVNQPGQYLFTVTNTVNGCVSSVPVAVDQDIQAPSVDAGQPFVLPCWKEVYPLQGSASVHTGAISIQWFTNDGSIVNGASTLQPGINSGGTYTIQVTNLFNGCVAEDLVVVTENTPQGIDPELDQPPCYGDPGFITLTDVIGGTPPYLYSVDGGNSFYPETDFGPLDPGNYTIVVQDALGCETQPLAVELVEPDELIVNLELTVELELGDSYQLNALVNVPDSYLNVVTWTPATGLSCSDCLRPIATPLQTTTYNLYVETFNGCVAEARTTLEVDRRPAVYIPNVFSPNNDGNNDVFMIFAKDESVVEVRSFLVFSRWGESVFEYYHFQPNNPAFGWDGYHRGEPLNPAVFAYFAEIEFIDGRIELFEGDVTLVR